MPDGFRMDPDAWAKIQRLSERARDRVLDDIAEDARRFAPVDTGELRESIHVDKHAHEVVASADHAVYVEQGTENMAAQPFLAPALYKRRNLRVDGIA